MKTRVRVSREELDKLFKAGICMRVVSDVSFMDCGNNWISLPDGRVAVFQFEDSAELEAEVIEAKSDAELLAKYLYEKHSRQGFYDEAIALLSSNAINPEFLEKLRSEQK